MYLPTKELPATSPAKVGKYHELAEAIRRGCERHPRQARRTSVDRWGGRCAMAAAVAGGYTKRVPQKLVNKIVFRNDWRFWSRERIADWLDTL